MIVMKKLLIMVLICPLFLVACFSDDNDNKTTLYEGVLLYEDDLSAVSGATLKFTGLKRVAGIGRLDETLIERDIPVSDDGTFRFELETTRAGIDYFSVGLYFGESPTSIDCAPNSCASLPPRTILTDLRFLAERE
jgi:hypothetical protein